MEMKVQAASGWQDTGFKPGAQSGKYVVVLATGEWNLREPDDKFGLRDPAGRRPNAGNSYMYSTEGGNFPYAGPGGYFGQLIGKIGANGAPFIVGTYGHIDIDSSDPNSSLWLCANDELNGQGDNSGALDVKIYSSDGGRDTTPKWHWDGLNGRWYTSSD